MFIALSFIALVASFSIIANLIMMVTEKAREVAILKSMGARDGAILRIFFAEGLTSASSAWLLGVVRRRRRLPAGWRRYGLPLPADVYYIQKLPVVMRAGEIAAVAAGGAGAVLPGHALPGVPGLPDAAGRRPAVRVAAVRSGLA